MKIGELANRTGVTKETIRRYVSIGLLSARRDQGNGYQIFNAKTLPRIFFLKVLRKLGVRLVDIQNIFFDAKKSDTQCPRVREILVRQIGETRKNITELSKLCDRMETSMAQWQQLPGGIPNGKSVQILIESHSEL